ncbi:exported protein of unknown function [Streptomyces ambofaciens ATCC 23877]|uniref:Uncharacterized protein n=1 Tax=Streptomyces ambofaciens (strain ATCC 23877 / 3486 / DSM 40053 / JCM 4204 / NBRC 12836 / NRRL B-2516) TaxID=278992 RepID=A0A0K2B6G0_STRA7|nr:exported protein of unknown function [Streptomyces ambofaciens ATCC 23877]AKZ60622.1 exported protein of unknown function [Streptomyces ambofaciens ATCC 23877]
MRPLAALNRARASSAPLTGGLAPGQIKACRRTVTLGWLRGDDPATGAGAVRMPSVDQGEEWRTS